uniref:Uncharacterized protein n=1 Tax=Acrobeloides nanus TaxID=290746 RepID=A0A914CE95_9BILA
MSASKEMFEKPSNSSSGLAELQPGPSSRCEPLENFYFKELKYEVALETLEFLKRNYDLKVLKKATAPVEVLAEIANCMDLGVNAALNPGATPNPRMEQFKQIRNCMSRDIDAQRFVQPKANECFQVLPLFVKYPGGYDEENCQFVYEKLIQEEKIVPRGKDFEITLKSDDEFTAARKFYLPKLEKAVLIRGYSKDALMAVHDCKLHVCLTTYQLDLIKEYCIEYGVYGKLSTLVEESGDRIAMEIIKNPKAWDNFISKLEAATEFLEQGRLFSHFQEAKENKALKGLSKEPKDGCSSIKTAPAVFPAIPKEVKENEELEKLISQFQLNSKMLSSSVPSVITHVVAEDDDEDWKKDADIEMQRRLLAQFEKNKYR